MSAGRDENLLTPSECLELLAQVEVGRIALSMDALPVILPVAFAVIDDQVHFRSIRDTKMDAAVDHRVVAFESGAYEPVAGTGWSVLIQGMAQMVDESDPLWSAAAAFRQPSEPTPLDDQHRMVRIRPGLVTGQRIRVTRPTTTTAARPDVPFLHPSSGD